MKTTLALYALAVALVVAYVNTFVIWQLLSVWLGSGVSLVPWLIAAGVAICIAAAWQGRRRCGSVSVPLILLSAVIAVVGMLLTDPLYPAKRVHVPQYAVLAGVVWAALSRIGGSDRIALHAILIAGLFGIHDEFLQGLHPDRTFGWRDMAVNFAGAIAGGLAIAGLSGQRIWTRHAVTYPMSFVVSGALVVLGLMLYIFAVHELRSEQIPYWSVLPLLSAAFALALASNHDEASDDMRHAGSVIVWLLLVLSVYPVLTNETSLAFA